MSEPVEAPRSPAARLAVPVVGAVLLGSLAYLAWRAGSHFDRMATEQAKVVAKLDEVLGEVTRTRLEQSSGTKGPQGLLEKLRTYAPLLANARVAEPDYRNAQKEMEAILRALGTLGSDAWQPIQDRLADRKPEKDFDEIKWLLEASSRIDAPATVPLLKEIVIGTKLPSPRLRNFAADLLTRSDIQVAQATLRQVLLTETSKGIDPARAQHYGPIPDAAALAGRGFNTFVVAYARTNDPKLEETLLMVIGRTIDDTMTVQECVKVLGQRKSRDAVPVIEKLFEHPPLAQENPLFLNHCLDALVAIQGKGAKPFLEKALASATHETVSKKIQALLAQIESGQIGAASPPPPAKVAPAANSNAKPEQGK